MELRLQSLYPAEMARKVLDRWPEAQCAAKHFPTFDLLTRVLDTAYQASLLREEGEPVRCRVAFGPPEDFETPHDRQTDSLVVFRFEQPYDLTAQQIRKLASAAGYNRAMLGVEAADEELRIWGLIFTGSHWVSRTDGGRLVGVPLPPNPIVHILSPGHLVVARGYDRVLETLGGLSLSDAFDPFLSQWLPLRFQTFRASLLEELGSCVSETPDTRICDSFVKSAAQSVMRRALSLTRSRRHGGTLIYLSQQTECCSEAKTWFRFRVTLKQDEATRRYRNLMQILLRRLLEIGQSQGLAVVTWDDYQRLQDSELASLDDGLIDFGHLLADLMSIDGALVLDRSFRVIGFGGEILGTEPVIRIHRALDLEAEQTRLERADDSGTRHRSAYRLVQGVPDAIAVVVSQDGAVQFVANHHRRLTYWPYLP